MKTKCLRFTGTWRPTTAGMKRMKIFTTKTQRLRHKEQDVRTASTPFGRAFFYLTYSLTPKIQETINFYDAFSLFLHFILLLFIDDKEEPLFAFCLLEIILPVIIFSAFSLLESYK